LGFIIFKLNFLLGHQLALFSLSVLFSLALIFSFSTNQSPWYQQLFGTWGRSTGLITYLSFIVLMISSTLIVEPKNLSTARLVFERLGYFVSLYTLIQLMQIDPINWSQKAMVATLGNINFMSSFLGMTSVSYISRAFFEKVNLSSRIFFTCVTLSNLSFILISKSIQGIAIVLASSILLITFAIRERWDFWRSLLFLSGSSIFGALLFLGSAGIGPLSSFRQETVIFRLDYWRAAISMIVANPLNGIGIDSYGDFYREYRNAEAVLRTGPQRVTNTAHNIFLDVTSGSGLIAGSIFVLIILLTGIRIMMNLNRGVLSPDYRAFCGIWIGFIVFCLISINQIGVGVWGFIFTGIINSYRSRNSPIEMHQWKTNRVEMTSSKSSGSEKLTKIEEKSKSTNNLQSSIASLLTSIVLLSSVGFVTFLTNQVDAKFAVAIRTQDAQIAIQLFDRFGVQDFHREKTIELLIKQGKNRDALQLAHQLIKMNQNNWFAWVTVFTNAESSFDERELAARELLRMDPNNLGLKADVERTLSER
jgi:O-antigen ligase